MTKIYALTLNLHGTSEIIHAFYQADAAKAMAMKRRPDLGPWVEHNSHGVYWEALFPMRTKQQRHGASSASYTVVEVGLE